ncbi:Hypothetical predicted protein [Cloeon dipterum]|uniref:Uncharacterized protein n=1 Tax=Cloeon dipterum TaxID=197152 RepID=A0A8S1E6T6_9INSE|nr:Hypothetical predicted protein [Cloeon dipterum]
MCLLTLIFVPVVLLTCASSSEYPSPVMNEHTEEYLKRTFEFFDQIDTRNFLLILGDLEGEQSNELSLFLTDDQTSYGERINQVLYPFVLMDNQTSVLIMDLPFFDESRSVHQDIMLAFTHKLIFEKAEKLRILIVVPDEGKKEIIRFSKLVVKLVALLNENLEEVSSSITLVGALQPGGSRKQVLTMLRDVVKTLQDDMSFMSDTISEIYGNNSAEDNKWIQNKLWWTQELMFSIGDENLFAVFRRPGKNGTFWSEENRKNLLIVDRRTKDFISSSEGLEYYSRTRSVLRNVTQTIVTSLLEIEFLRHNKAYLNVLLSYGGSMQTPKDRFYDEASLGSDVWRKLEFEFEKLDFFEQLRGGSSTLKDFDLRNLLVSEVQGPTVNAQHFLRESWLHGVELVLIFRASAGGKMRIIWMIILAHSVLMACASRSDNFHAPEKNKINNVKRYMKSFFNFLERTNNDEFLLILGDSDGESSELSLFLTGAGNQTKSAKRYNQIHFPFFAVDKQTGVLVVDLPNFDVFHNVYVDLMMAFTHKLIFEKAKSLQILLVMPDKGKKEIVRFWRLAMKLVATLDENLEDVSSSIALVGVKNMRHLMFNIFLMMACVSSGNSPPKNANWMNAVSRYMRKTYDFLKSVDHEEFILILGDVDGSPYELSRYLRDDHTPVRGEDRILRHPRFDVDNATNAMIIDLPDFNEYFNIPTDLMFSFMHKLIFDRAKNMKIVLVVPDKGDKEIIRFTMLLSKLVAILNKNYGHFYDSIGMVSRTLCRIWTL